MFKVLSSTAVATLVLGASVAMAGAQQVPNPNIDHTPNKPVGVMANVQVLWGPGDNNDGGQRNSSCSVTRDFVLNSEGDASSRVLITSIESIPFDGEVLPPNRGNFVDGDDDPFSTVITPEQPILQATWTNSDYLPDGELYLIAQAFNETPNGLVQVGLTYTEIIPSCFIDQPTTTTTTQPEPTTTTSSPSSTTTEPESSVPSTSVPTTGTSSVTPTTNSPKLPNCEELGLTNISTDHPQYRSDLDNDGDGVACEALPRTGTNTMVLAGAALLLVGSGLLIRATGRRIA